MSEHLFDAVAHHLSPLDTQRHSLAHILGAAIVELYPHAKLGVGPVIANGFYYDFDLGETTITPDDLPRIEKKMHEIILRNESFSKEVIDRENALIELEKMHQTYKQEIVRELPENTQLSFYRTGAFVDLCKGPHVEKSESLRHLGWKLDRVAGAYWRGSEKNPMLQRIYGLAFSTQEELNSFIAQREEARQRDHRKIGTEQELFMFHTWSPGIPFWLPKGNVLRLELERFAREISYGPGYEEVKTPQLFSSELWKKSGHWEHYDKDMFKCDVEGDTFSLKPMNCPAHMLIFNSKVRSYRDLPLRLAELTQLHRNELSGTLSGMTRVRAFCQDDSHIFVRPDQIQKEVHTLIENIKKIYDLMGMNLQEIVLSTRPKKFLGDEKIWNEAESSLQSILEQSNLPWKINPGDGAFYGPKVDFRIADALQRTHQLATIQLDFQMPIRFQCEYIGEDGLSHTPVVIHRALLGSIERFIGIMIEHFAGSFPLWLSPEQILFAPVADSYTHIAQEMKEACTAMGLRAIVDDSQESVGKKVRNASKNKVPYIIVIGAKEAAGEPLTVRVRGREAQWHVPFKDFLATVQRAYAQREHTLPYATVEISTGSNSGSESDSV
jgi:threonyl-tRNA synthetase